MSDISERSFDPPGTIRLLAVWPEEMTEKLETAAGEQISALRLLISEARPDTLRQKLKVGRHHILVMPQSAIGASALTDLAADQLSLVIITPLSGAQTPREDWAALAPAVLVLPAGVEAEKLLAFVHELCRLIVAGYHIRTAIQNAWDRAEPSSLDARFYLRNGSEAVWPPPTPRTTEEHRRPASSEAGPSILGSPLVNIHSVVYGDVVHGDKVGGDKVIGDKDTDKVTIIRRSRLP